MTLTAGSPAAPLDVVVLPDPDTGAPGRWTATARQQPSTGPTTAQDHLALFGPASPAGQAADP
ncbi:MAG TPA: hypothetical protein DD420_25865, partial [Streptomyces sp.]|nr:hypothetical protein [Streptomyces sp.]